MKKGNSLAEMCIYIHTYIFTLYMVSEGMGWFEFSSPLLQLPVDITLLATSFGKSGILGAE